MKRRPGGIHDHNEPGRHGTCGRHRAGVQRVMNLSHLMRQCARRHGGEIGLAWGDESWSWAQLDRRIDAAAAGLAERGGGEG